MKLARSALCLSTMLMAVGAFSASVIVAPPAAAVAAPAMCPPSEGDFDFEFYDISGDGQVLLPEKVQLKVVAKTSATDAAGKVVVDDRMALVLEDPTNKNARVLTMKLTTHVADEIHGWLASAIESQESWLKTSKQAEKPGIECSLDAKQCRAMTTNKKANVKNMYVRVASAAGQQGWSAVPAAAPAAGQKHECPAQAAAQPVDRRITLTAYDYRAGMTQPLSVKMDTPTAKALLADLSRMMDEKNGKVAPKIEKETDASKTAS